jgi:D-alanyl-D-alanine carboxypeptidase
MNHKDFSNKRILITTAVLSFLLIASFLLLDDSSKEVERSSRSFGNPNLEKEVDSLKIDLRDPFEKIGLTAQAAYVWDIKSQRVIFEHRSSEVFPLASVTKALMALTAYEMLPSNTEINIEKDFLKAEGDTGLLVDERWRMKDLIDFSLLTSSNDAALALASVAGAIRANTSDYNLGREVFVSLMNNKAEQLNLGSVAIYNESGLDQDDLESGAYGSARDVARLFEHILRVSPEILESTTLSQIDFTSLSGREHRTKNTNVVADQIPGLIASKTGFTDLAGGNLAIVFDPTLGRPIVIVVLGSSFDDRFRDALKLAQAAKKYLEKETHQENLSL